MFKKNQIRLFIVETTNYRLASCVSSHEGDNMVKAACDGKPVFLILSKLFSSRVYAYDDFEYELAAEIGQY